MTWNVNVFFDENLGHWRWKALSLSTDDVVTSSGHVIRATKRGAAAQARRAIRKWENRHIRSTEDGMMFRYTINEPGRGPW